MHTNRLSKFLVIKRCRIAVFCFAFLAVGSLSFNQLYAQKLTNPKPALKRCGTMEGIQMQMQKDPALKERMRQAKIDYQNSLGKPVSQSNQMQKPLALPGPVTIPLVVHIVLPNPWVITDDAVQFFIDKLNKDFAGINADSTNGTGFYPVRGHSLLQFTLAKRDPNGNFTTGVLRVEGITQIESSNPQPIKNSSSPTGGSTGWDVSKYYNLYVGDGSDAGLLGIAPGIGPGGIAGSDDADGVCIDYRTFTTACFSFKQYNLGRTAVHEIGHNFGLYHPFDNACTTNDFNQLTSAGCLLPAALLAPSDDIPNQENATSGCPEPGADNGCTPATPRMFQNFMDYTDDACYSMFSKGSVKRMEWVLENCRAGYLTTLGGQYPNNLPALDASINNIVSPGGKDFNPAPASCTSLNYPVITCPGIFTPRIRIINAGTSTLTSITVTTSINGLNPVSQTFPINIATGKSQVLQLANQVAVFGNNALKFSISAPNNGADANATNNDLTLNFNIATILPLPYSESFENLPFPPNNGSYVVNPDAPDITWARTTLAARPENASMWINCYDYTPDNNNKLGQRDIYRLPPINAGALDSIAITFNVAHQPYFGDGVTEPTKDSLRIIYSTDCGNTWKPTSYSKGGTSLSTVAGSTDVSFFPANANQWRTERVIVRDICGDKFKNMVFGFESVNDFGNNIFVDSINIIGFNALTSNVSVESIIQPSSALCSNSITPQIIITNKGTDTLKALKITYQIDNTTPVIMNWTGSLAKCENTSINLTAANSTVGFHTLIIYTSLPNGQVDQSPANDTLKKSFTIFTTAAAPLFEGLESNIFPPANWGLQNVNGGNTWESSSLSAKTGKNSLLIKNADASNFNGTVDYFISPIVINDGTSDSVFVNFDLANNAGIQTPGTTLFPVDTLEILATNDCGASFQSVWKKYGYDLQTVIDPNYNGSIPFVPGKTSDWKPNKLFLSPFIGKENFQLYFASRGNKLNNIWLDNINITQQILPKRLKQQGYLIYPNPFNNTFLIHHSAVLPPLTLQSVQVFNGTGQKVWDKRYNGNAERQITVDLKNVASGVYLLKLVYSNKTITEKIVKD